MRRPMTLVMMWMKKSRHVEAAWCGGWTSSIGIGSGSSGRLWFGDLVGGTANVREHITHGGNVMDESVAGTLPDGVPNIVPMSDGEGFTDGIHEAIALG